MNDMSRLMKMSLEVKSEIYLISIISVGNCIEPRTNFTN
jgi:hypothetical protein